MRKPLPEVSPELEVHLGAILANPERIVERTYAYLIEADQDYAALPPLHKRDLLDSIRSFTLLWCTSLLERKNLSAEDIQVLASAGRRRVHQGIGLSSVLRAFRAGTREILDASLDLARGDPKIKDELLFSAFPYLLEYADIAAQAIAQAYLDEQFRGERWRDARRYELCNTIFSAPEDGQSFFRSTEALGLNAHGARIAITLDMNLSEVDRTRVEDALDDTARTLARLLQIDVLELFRAMHHGYVVVWAPCNRGESMLQADARFMKALRTLVRASPLVRRAAIGLQGRGAAGWAETARQSVRALELGSWSGDGAELYSYAGFLLSESARRDPTSLQYLDSIVERLSHEQELIPTLRAYFEGGMSRKVASATLAIHPNTLGYRLSRIEELLGLSLSRIEDLTVLHMAIALTNSTPRNA